MQTEYPHPTPNTPTYNRHRIQRGTHLAFPDWNDPMSVSVDMEWGFTGKNGDLTDIKLTTSFSPSLARQIAYINLADPTNLDEYRAHWYNLRPMQRRGNFSFEALFTPGSWTLDGTRKIDTNGVDITTYGVPHVWNDASLKVTGIYKDISGTKILIVPGSGGVRATKAVPEVFMRVHVPDPYVPYHSLTIPDTFCSIVDPTALRTDTTLTLTDSLSITDIDTDLDATFDFTITFTLQ